MENELMSTASNVELCTIGEEYAGKSRISPRMLDYFPSKNKTLPKDLVDALKQRGHAIENMSIGRAIELILRADWVKQQHEQLLSQIEFPPEIIERSVAVEVKKIDINGMTYTHQLSDGKPGHIITLSTGLLFVATEIIRAFAFELETSQHPIQIKDGAERRFGFLLLKIISDYRLTGYTDAPVPYYELNDKQRKFSLIMIKAIIEFIHLHEIAHIVLGHTSRQPHDLVLGRWYDIQQVTVSREEEYEADRYAIEGLLALRNDMNECIIALAGITILMHYMTLISGGENILYPSTFDRLDSIRHVVRYFAKEHNIPLSELVGFESYVGSFLNAIKTSSGKLAKDTKLLEEISYIKIVNRYLDTGQEINDELMNEFCGHVTKWMALGNAERVARTVVESYVSAADFLKTNNLDPIIKPEVKFFYRNTIKATDRLIATIMTHESNGWFGKYIIKLSKEFPTFKTALPTA